MLLSHIKVKLGSITERSRCLIPDYHESLAHGNSQIQYMDSCYFTLTFMQGLVSISFIALFIALDNETQLLSHQCVYMVICFFITNKKLLTRISFIKIFSPLSVLL
jgi:hypothetical protein